MATPSAHLRRPPGRYDDRRSLPRPVLIGGAALLLLALVVASYLAFQRYSDARSRFGLLGYGVLSDTSVEVRFEVHLPVGATATCLVRARDARGVVVGSDDVAVGPSGREQVVVVHDLTTSVRAATAEVTSCSAPVVRP